MTSYSWLNAKMATMKLNVKERKTIVGASSSVGSVIDVELNQLSETLNFLRKLFLFLPVNHK